MGYTTDFSGSFELNKQLGPNMKEFLTKLNETRRMKRKVSDKFGVDGEFFVGGTGSFGQDSTGDVVDYNEPPSTQPGLWCQWTPTQDGMGIEWDGGEKFYNYTEWLVYIINKLLEPNGYVLNGVVQWQGEEVGDVGEIFVEDNKVFTQEWKGSKNEIEPCDVQKNSYSNGKFNLLIDYMQTDLVLIVKESKVGDE
jgi:hypothetical protein